MKVASLALLICAFSVAAMAAAARPNTLQMEVDMKTEIYNGKTRQSAWETQSRRIWIKGKSVRIEEGTIGGTTVMIEARNMQYLYSPEEKQGVKARIPRPLERLSYPDYFDVAGLKDWLENAGAKKTGSERVNGVDTDLYSQSEGRTTMRRWVRKDNMLPVRIVIEASGTGGSRRTDTMNMSTIKAGGTIADSMFTPPSGYKFVEVKDPRKAGVGKRKSKGT